MKNIFKSFYQNPSVWFTTSYDQNKLNQNMYSILNSHKIFKSNELFVAKEIQRSYNRV